jgi:HEAT repeat protein
MDFLRNLFGAGSGPSERQIRRATRQVTQTHGDAAVRLSAMERLADWKTPAAAAALLRRFTIQVPQATMDQEEKQYTVKLLVQMGRQAVEPIVQYVESEPEVTWPIRALREILPQAEFTETLQSLLTRFSAAYTRWPEAKKVLIEHLPDEAFAQVRDAIFRALEDDDDDVCIAAIDYLARSGDEPVREHLLQTFLGADSRPRVRGRILDHFCELEWPVKGYRKKVEEAIVEPFYLTSKGTVKRRSQEFRGHAS